MDKDLLKNLTKCFDLSPEEAVDYMKSQGYDISWDWKDQLEIIKNHCFTVAKVTSADILQTFHDELTKALEDGQSYTEFKKAIKPTLILKGYSTREDGTAWRLDTIYRTNLQTSYMAGRYFEMKEIEDDYPYWQIIVVMDNRTRHAALNNKVLKANDPFCINYYVPFDYQCRCRIRALDDNYIKTKNLKVVSGKDLNFTPAEGFANNPSETWQPDLTKYTPEIKKELSKVI